MIMARVRNLANWCNLSTPLGLAVAVLGRSRLRRRHDGLWVADGYRLPFPIAGAFTVGSVIITADDSWDELTARRPELFAHEEHHTWQYAYSLGLLYLPAYAAAMGWSWLRTGDRAAANAFERAAGLERGGYRAAPLRPLSQGFAHLGRESRALLRTRRWWRAGR